MLVVSDELGFPYLLPTLSLGQEWRQVKAGQGVVQKEALEVELRNHMRKEYYL